MSLIVGIVLYLMYRVFNITLKSSVLPLGSFHEVLSSWCLVMGFLGFGLKYLRGTSGFLKYSTEAVLPFYILHQPVILVIAFWVVQLQLPVIAKYIIIVVLSFVIIIGLYEVVKRVSVLRFLFGMKLRRAVAKVHERD
jgi:glucan biosynthesis protein C